MTVAKKVRKQDGMKRDLWNTKTATLHQMKFNDLDDQTLK